MKTYILCITATSLSVPFLFYMNNVVRDFVMDDLDKRYLRVEDLLAVVLFLAIYAAQWFWSNPVQYGFAHIVDGVVAKITIAAFFVYYISNYTAFQNKKIEMFEPIAGFFSTQGVDSCISRMHLLFALLCLLIVFAAMSHWSSSKEWCSDSHIFWHGGLHLIGSWTAIYAFI